MSPDPYCILPFSVILQTSTDENNTSLVKLIKGNHKWHLGMIGWIIEELIKLKIQFQWMFFLWNTKLTH